MKFIENFYTNPSYLNYSFLEEPQGRLPQVPSQLRFVPAKYLDGDASSESLFSDAKDLRAALSYVDFQKHPFSERIKARVPFFPYRLVNFDDPTVVKGLCSELNVDDLARMILTFTHQADNVDGPYSLVLECQLDVINTKLERVYNRSLKFQSSRSIYKHELVSLPFLNLRKHRFPLDKTYRQVEEVTGLWLRKIRRLLTDPDE